MRRSWRAPLIVGLVSAGVLIAAVFGWRFARSSTRPSGPIILISLDTTRADHLSIYGYTHGHTPAIDALARDGVVFERAYAQAPQTLPEHTSILTGELPFQHGVRDNLGFTLTPGAATWPRLLAAHGYATAGFVSSYVLRPDTGINQGFETYDAAMPASSPETSVGDVRRDGQLTEQAAERWIDGQSSSRFFLFLHLYDVHRPYEPRPAFKALAPYDQEVAYDDQEVGQLIGLLKRKGLYDQATIVLLSDHGEGLGDHGELEHGVFIYDDTIRVALVMKLPGNRSAGRRVPVPVQHIDVLPTILDLLHMSRPSDLRGRSLVPALDGTGTIPEQGIYAEAMYPRYHFGWSDLHSLTDVRYRYIQAPHPELYDLERDPGERHNIAADRPRVAEAMAAALTQMMSGAKADAPSQVSPDTLARLQSLGYVGTVAAVSPSTPSSTLPDPKDKLPVLERYRQAVDDADSRQFEPAIALLRQIVAGDPEMADVWDRIGNMSLRIGRSADAADAYKRFIALKPDQPIGYMGAATALMQLKQYDAALEHARLAARVSGTGDPHGAANAHALAARIAIAAGHADEARQEALAAEQIDPTLPMKAFVDARLLYDEGKYADALPHFQAALAQAANRPVQVPELHYYAGDTFGRLNQYPQAEQQFSEELKYFPQNTRAYAGLAMVYRAAGQDAQSDAAVQRLLQASPIPDSYALAAKLWTMFGEPQQAEAARAEARRRFGTRRQ
ncbi:MAG TPA: sulfatase-like hydrolase/transferase [Vicinamibacterales bacterium]